ncbi:hypothetical protein, partial [Pseudomonas viridiflava]|uniref:hypothetical protein n=1 Tax=Pseudomonas viridiflava TaxID=33069 RepID=UPI0013E05C83
EYRIKLLERCDEQFSEPPLEAHHPVDAVELTAIVLTEQAVKVQQSIAPYGAHEVKECADPE